MKRLLSLLLCINSWGLIAQTNFEVFENLVEETLPHYYYLHQNPELSLQESGTSAYLKQQLQLLEFDLIGPFGVHGFAGVLPNGPGRVVWIRADMDALPVKEDTGVDFASTKTSTLNNGTTVSIMHACGHDMHMASWLGTARFLSENRDKWTGTVVFVAQPAEEFGDGAKKMINDGLFKQLPVPDYVLAQHVSATLQAGTIGYAPGYSYANVDAMKIVVYGFGGHGAYPHTTIDPVVLASRVVLGLQTLVSRKFSPLEPLVITAGSIQGGTKANIIPTEVQLQLTIRYHNESLRPKILSSIRELTEGIAFGAGLSKEQYPRLEYYPENLPGVYNDPELTSRLAAVWSKEMGEDRIQQVPPSMGGEDFGRFGTTEHQVPLSIFWVGSVEPEKLKMQQIGKINLPSLHSSEFLPQTKPTLTTGIEATSIAVLELLK